MHKLILKSAVLVAVLCVSNSAYAGLLTFNSPTPTSNVSTRSDWLTSVGISSPDNLVNFESGFVNNQNIAGVTGLFGDGFVIRDTGSTGPPSAIIRSGSGEIGNSNPIGMFSVTHDEQANLVLDFAANPVDYVAFQDIDHTGTGVKVTFLGGGTTTFSLDSTSGSGDTGEFFGINRNDLPRITLIELNASGDGRWGLDTIEYGGAGSGGVPEPSSIWIMGAAMAIVSGRYLRRRRRRPAC